LQQRRLKRRWELADRRLKTKQILLALSKVKEILAQLHGGHLGVNKAHIT
jgi:hypothetical protein